MHKEITSKELPIYDVKKAEAMYKMGRIGYRKLSLMKQRNIKEAIESGKYRIIDILRNINKFCGYCFAYSHWHLDCLNCPIYNKLGVPCHSLKEWDQMERARTFKQLREAHKAWCKKIGLDVYKREE